MPTNVCKATYRPQSNGNIDLHSSMYICEPNGTFVYQYHWNNNTLCQGPLNLKAIAYTNQSQFNCGGDICPYAIMRFYDKERSQDPDKCVKNDTEWAEAIFTTYQCLHDDENPSNWFQLTCTKDGSQLVDNGYNSPNCKNLNYSDMYDEGCLYKDKYIEVLHCDYWNVNGSMSDSPTMRPTEIPTIAPTVSGGGGDGMRDNDKTEVLIVWIIVLCILFVIIVFIVKMVIRNKLKRQSKETKKMINAIIDDGDVVNNESSISDMAYDKIESEERKIEPAKTELEETLDMHNDGHREFVSPQEIASNTPQTALLNHARITN